jgi:hypothetical protein
LPAGLLEIYIYRSGEDLLWLIHDSGVSLLPFFSKTLGLVKLIWRHSSFHLSEKPGKPRHRVGISRGSGQFQPLECEGVTLFGDVNLNV